MASPDARFLPEERNYTLIDALGLAQGGDSSLLHDLEVGSFLPSHGRSRHPDGLRQR